MSSPQGKRDVVRLRTFASDLDKVQQEKGISKQEIAQTDPEKEAAPKSRGFFFKVHKKDLAIKDTSAQATALDAEGVSFDEETAEQVEEQSYEANQSIIEGPAVDQAINIHDSEVTGTADDFLAGLGETPAPTATSAEKIAPSPQATNPSPNPLEQKIEIKSQETIDHIRAPQASTLGDNLNTVHDITEHDVGGGSIVTDKKRDRFKLIPAIGEAVGNWFTETKDTIEEAGREKHTVERPENRAETIKAAAQEKTLAPDEDFAVVAQRLKNTKKVTEPVTPVVVAPKTEVQASWTYTIPDGNETSPSMDTVPAAEVATPEPVTITQTIAPAVEGPIVHEIKEAKMSAADLASLVGPSLSPSKPPEVLKPEPQSLPAMPNKNSNGFSLPAITLPSLSSGREFLPSPMIAIAVVVAAIVAGVGTSMFFFWQPDQSTVLPEATTIPLFTAQLQTNIEFTDSHSEVMGTFLAAINSSPDSLYMYLARNNGQDVLTPTEVMGFLAPLAPGSFTRSVTNVSFGSLTNRPFIIMKVNNFDNAFSGMLAWEQTMSADLAPLFGPVVTESYDPQARTATQTRGAFFKDVVASNLSGRLLTNERSEDRILYVFLDKQTIVISTDRLQLANLLPLLR